MKHVPAHFVVASALLIAPACSNPNPPSRLAEHLVDKAEFAIEEAPAKYERHELREMLRERGLRVCEEGEWPQRWGEDCNACWCDVGEVRICQMAHCRSKNEVASPGSPPRPPFREVTWSESASETTGP